MPRSKTAPNTFSNRNFLLLLLLVFVLGFFTVSDILSNKRGRFSQNSYSQIPKSVTDNIPLVFVKDIKVNVELADTDSLRERGLSFRESLDKNSGMLFVFEKPVKPFFWMKDMNFPLDMIWIADNKIVDIDRNVPVPKENTPLNQLIKYSPKEEVDYVLEVNAGFTDDNRIEIGDEVKILPEG